MWLQIEIPGDVKAEINISFAPGAGCIADILWFNHTLGIGHDQLKYMTTGFDIPAQRK